MGTNPSGGQAMGYSGPLGHPDASVVVRHRRGPRTVVFLHGFSFDGRMWEPVIDRLPADLGVVAVDLPGFGRSPVPSRAVPMHDALVGALDALGLGPVDLVGHSYGGQAAVDAALAAPERVSSLTLTGSGLTGFPTPQLWRSHMAAILAAARAGDLDTALDRWWSHPNFGPPGSRLRRILVSCSNAYTGWHWVDSTPSPVLAPATERLGEVRAPTAVLVGRADTDQARQMAEALAAGIPDSRLVVLPGGHVLPVEHPDLFTAELQRQLDASDPATRQEIR